MISGEDIQELCDAYCGFEDDFNYNPRIRSQISKQMNLQRLNEPWDNPRTLFCYTHRVNEFMKKVSFLQNEFILVTHNSDGNITEHYIPLLDNPKLIFWHAQNLLIRHPKLGGIPIGIANSMWPHGNKDSLISVIGKRIQKVNSVYFQFSIGTNPTERNKCFAALKHLPWQDPKPFSSYLETLASYKYAICPPGNGLDCHRIWECLYLGVIPILLRSVFTERIQTRFPCILLNSWNDFNESELYYSGIPLLSISDIKECIQTNRMYF